MIPASALRDSIRNAAAVKEVIADEMVASLPIPLRQPDGRLVAAVFFFAQHFQPQTRTAQLYPPTWLGHFDWETGAVLGIESAEPGHLGLGGDRFHPFAEISYRDIDTAARNAGLGGAVARSEELNPLYDYLVPAWLAGGPPDPAAAQRFIALFPTVALPPMLSIYRRVGDAFFSWLGVPA